MSKDSELSAYLSAGEPNIKTAISMIKAGADGNTPNRLGDNLLHMAINTNNPLLIKMVLDLGVDPKVDPNMTNANGHPPLYRVLCRKPVNFEAAFLLIKAGASPHVVNEQGQNLLHLAAQSGELLYIYEAIKLKVHLNTLDRLGRLPLAYALATLPVNMHSVALLVLASAFNVRDAAHLTLLFPRLEEKPRPASSSQLPARTYQLRDSDLSRLGSTIDNKLKIVNYIRQLPANVGLSVIQHAKYETVPLGRVFYKQRIFLKKPSIQSGTLAKLMELEAHLNKTPVEIGNRIIHRPPTSSSVPSASPYFEAGELVEDLASAPLAPSPFK